MDLRERDRAVLWHPCTQMQDHERLPPIAIRRAHGVWLEDEHGRRYLDAISSWWVNLFGHAHPTISAAVCRQAQDLEHVLLAGFTHEPAVALAERLIEMSPAEPENKKRLTRCFYADNGSTAVEVALKMSFHYWRNRGDTRKTRFIALENAYHGETLGALAVSDLPLYRESYGPLLMDVIRAPSPDCYHRDPGEGWGPYSARRFEPLARLLERHADEVCAVIIEPLVQCAGGMRMYHPIYLERLRAACDAYGVHLIADEVAVGFGRTGSMFACEQAAVSPDFLCLSKGLTGGYLALGAVLTTDEVYRAFYGDFASRIAFLHSHSYTGNPLACRAALATLGLFDERPVLEHNRLLARTMAAATAHLHDHPHVAEVRQTGMILAIELVKDKVHRVPYPWQERRGRIVYVHGLSRGVLLRPLGDVVYFMPPYVITEDEIRLMVEVATEGIERATAQ